MKITGEEIKRLFDAYQANYNFERKAAALSYAYIHGFQTKDLEVGSAGNISYTPIYKDAEDRRITEFACNQLIDPYRQYRYELISKDIEPEGIPAQKDDAEATEAAPRLNEFMSYLRAQAWDNDGFNKSLAAWSLTSGTVYSMQYPEDDGVGYTYSEQDGKVLTELKEDNGKYTYQDKAVDNIRKRTPKKLMAACKTIWEVAHSCDGDYNKIDTSTWQILKSIKSLKHLRDLATTEIIAKIEKALPAQTKGLKPLWSDDIEAATGIPSGEGGGTFAGDDRQVYCFTYYHKDGTVRTVADVSGGLVEVYDSNKLPLGIMPFLQFDVAENNAHRYIQLSPFYHAIGLQTIYNSIVNSRAAHERLAARPPLKRFKGMLGSPEIKQVQAWGGDSKYPTYAEVYEWYADPATLSQMGGNVAALSALSDDFMTVPSVSAGVVEFLQSIKTMIIDVLGTNMANMGRMPQSVSGVALDAQASIDTTGYIPLIKSWQAFKKKFWFNVMRAIPVVYDKIDVAKVLHQPVSKIDAIFTNSITDSYDIKYADTSALPSSPIKRIEALTNLMAVLPPQLQAQAVKFITNVMGDIGLNIGVPNIEEELAEKENEYILNDDQLLALAMSKDPKDKELVGQILFSMATPLQNDDIHDGTHRKPIIGPEAMNHAPERLQMLTLHIQIHEQNKLSKQIGSQPQIEDGQNGTESGLQTPDTQMPGGATPGAGMPG
jgi:hypothetical protein